MVKHKRVSTTHGYSRKETLQLAMNNYFYPPQGHVVVNVQAMVDNPIYVGDDEEQYENIEGYQPTFISGPPQIQIGPAPYAETGPPPTLPAPRMVSGKEKEFVDACAKSTDGLSQVSTGEDSYTIMSTAGTGTATQVQRDDQNIYVKSEF